MSYSVYCLIVALSDAFQQFASVAAGPDSLMSSERSVRSKNQNVMTWDILLITAVD